MAHINLLPWRAERQKQREREFYMMLLATALCAAAVLVVAILWMGGRIDDQNSRNTYLQEQVKELEKQITEIEGLDKTRQQLLTRKEIIEQLQSNRSQMVHLFDEMVKTIPDGVRLITMKQAGDTLTLEGVAESSSRVASYMRNIDNSPWMGHSDLRKLENQSGNKDVDKKMPFLFSLDVRLRKPQEAQDGEQAANNPAAKGAGAASGGTPSTDAGKAPPAAKPEPAKPEPAPSGGKPASAAPSATPATPATGEKK
jgi:type IV pilus assembly protein PilN